MNILYFLNFYPTKHKIVAHDEMLEMSKRGHQITVIAVWGGEKVKTSELPFNVHYLENKIQFFSLMLLFFKFGKKGVSHLRLLEKYLGFRDSLKFFSSYRLFLKINPEHIHAHFANNAALKGYLLSKFLGVPFSCTGHGSEILLYPEPYLKELILASKPFITISEYNKKYLMDKYEIPGDKLVINYCGIDIDYFNRKGAPYPEVFSILSITAMRRVKGVEYLIKACQILKTRGIAFRCTLVGGGTEYDQILYIVKNLKLEREITLTGAVDHNKIREHLLNASVFVLPSLSEGIPVSIMEAMAVELPVIATNITGIPEIVHDGISGFLVPPENSEEIAEKLLVLYQDRDLMVDMARKGRLIIEGKFNLRKNVSRFEKLIVTT